MKATSFSTAERPHHRWPTAITAKTTASKRAAPATRKLRRTRGSGAIACSSGNPLHDQAGVGSAKAEAVVEHCADLARLGCARDKIDTFAPIAGVFEVDGRRSDLIPQREDAEDALDRTGSAEQMADHR